MKWLLDGILVLLMAIIIYINAKRGCKTFLKLISPIVSFACAYFFGPSIGISLFGTTGNEVSEGFLADILSKVGEITVKIQNSIAAAVGCVIVFLVVSVIMLIVRLLFGAIVDKPILKQADKLLGIVFGVVTAFIYAWVACVIISIIIEYNLIGDSKLASLESIATDSILFRFFCGISLFDFAKIIPIF